MKYKAYTLHNYDQIPQFDKMSQGHKDAVNFVARVLPFKTNNYVVDELIDWDNYEDDPFFILNFPQREMLCEEDYQTMENLVSSGADKSEIAKAANDIRLKLNPHPAGQMEYNVPELDGEKLLGIQHKYRETMLFFPSQGQTCHAYCTFCFRWPQFSGMGDLKFAMKQADLVVKYLERHQNITDLLITGGDPMIMNIKHLSNYIDAILESGSHNLNTIRIGTKSLGFWPYRFTTDKDADDVLRLFEKVTKSGIHLALMAHFSHPRELSTDTVKEAIRRIRSTGAEIRTQSPVLKHINDKPELWARMWKTQVQSGLIPYYMFVARDTGAQEYFGIPLDEAWKIFRKAYNQVSGLARTVRGPSMSAGPGKVHIVGVSQVKDEKVFVLNFLQGRNPEWAGRPFFARYDPKALWLDDLKPAFGEDEFFFEENYREMLKKDDKRIKQMDQYRTTA